MKKLYVALITPFTSDRKVDYDQLERFIEYQIEGGSDSIIVCGTTGEASTLTHEEHLETIRFTVDKVAKRIPVIAGTGSNCTETAIYLSKEAQKSGVENIVTVVGYKVLNVGDCVYNSSKKRVTIVEERFDLAIPTILR